MFYTIMLHGTEEVDHEYFKQHIGKRFRHFGKLHQVIICDVTTDKGPVRCILEMKGNLGRIIWAIVYANVLHGKLTYEL